MALGKRNKISAEFSMSSLTDIIFLLLIFFMLTANFVKIDPFELPDSDSKTVASTSIAVSVTKKGKFKLNGQEMPLRAIEAAVKREMRKAENQKSTTLTIAAEKGTSFNYVVSLMNIASRLRMKAILATQPRQ